MRRVLKSPFAILIAVAVIAGSSCGLVSGLVTKDIGGALVIAGIIVFVILAPATALVLAKTLSRSRRAPVEGPSPEGQPARESMPSKAQVAYDKEQLQKQASDPESRFQTASLMILLIAGLNIVAGWVAWVFRFELLRSAGMRTVSYLLSSLPFGWGFLWSLWDADRQAGHDRIAGTLVVPASVGPEQLQGIVEPAEARRGRKRWLIGLGVSSLLMAIGILLDILRMMD